MGYFTWIIGGRLIDKIQLDIVGFLAVLGEGAVLSNAQVAALHRITYLPRLMPAPQALIRPSRPEQLAPHVGVVTAVHSGNLRQDINHVGHILADAEHYPDYSIRCVKIVRKTDPPFHRKEDKGLEESTVTARDHGPLTWVALIGCALSIFIFAFAVWQKDGMAMLADILLSVLSTVVAIATKWKLTLPKRKTKTLNLPPGDVVIRYTKGNFLIVTCDEDVARELYFAPENLEYLVKSSWQYRMISLVGTIMLMFGIIFLGNADIKSQLAFAAAYIIMNALYWIVAALPSSVHWDTRCFEVQEQCIQSVTISKADIDSKTEPTFEHSIPKPYSHKHKTHISLNSTFTEVLWRAIVVTKNTEWIKRSAAAPDTPAWNEWLKRAEKKAAEGEAQWVDANGDGKKILMWNLPDWNPGAVLGECLHIHNTDTKRVYTPPPSEDEQKRHPGADDNV